MCFFILLSILVVADSLFCRNYEENGEEHNLGDEPAGEVEITLDFLAGFGTTLWSSRSP
jgi:hypothetical protein